MLLSTIFSCLLLGLIDIFVTQLDYQRLQEVVHTHPEVVHPLADPAVLLWDFLLKVLIEARLHREDFGKRGPVVLFL